LLNSLDYRNFADKLLGWAEECQGTSQQDENAFNEFDEEAADSTPAALFIGQPLCEGITT